MNEDRARLKQMVENIRAALERVEEQAEQLRKSHERTLYLSQKLMEAEAQCHNVRGEDGPCDCAGCQDVAALRQRVEELEREKYGTPCRCEQWVKACGEAEERAEAAEAKLARLEGLILAHEHAYMNEMPHIASETEGNLLHEARRIRAQRKEGR